MMRLGLLILVLATTVSGCKPEKQDDPPKTATETSGAETTKSEDAQAEPKPGEPVFTISGFKTPESVLHDPDTDVYYVSNLGGPTPLAKDGNGFISRVQAETGEVELRWIEVPGTLNAPKGMALVDDTLVVSDIDVVHIFDKATGKLKKSIPFPEATFLNDVAAGADGRVYITDSGMKKTKDGLVPSGTDAVYELEGPLFVAMTADLKHPNGVAHTGKELWVVTMGAKELASVGDEALIDTIATFPAGSLDGLVVLEDETVLVSSWEGKAVYRRTKDGAIDVVVANIDSPADIGYDAKRKLILIPKFMENEVVGYALPALQASPSQPAK